jgi:hypothetical protein
VAVASVERGFGFESCQMLDGCNQRQKEKEWGTQKTWW